jgi:hypothetical protein
MQTIKVRHPNGSQLVYKKAIALRQKENNPMILASPVVLRQRDRDSISRSLIL